MSQAVQAIQGSEQVNYEDKITARVLLGPAGSGKSTMIRSLIESHKLLLTATTGVAAYNLGEGATTINALMGFFNEESLIEQMSRPSWASYKYDQLKDYDGIVIDEISMKRALVLDLLTSAFLKLSTWRVNEGLNPLKILLVGDFLQLPPVSQGMFPPYCFDSGWWPSLYEPNTTLLSKIYRQTDQAFIDSLTLARKGCGFEAAQALKQQGARFTAMPFYEFPGFSLYPTNASVGVHNRTMLDKIDAPGVSLQSERWGDQPEDLKEVPEVVALKHSCRIRITANDSFSASGGQPRFVNGQLGSLISYSKEEGPLVSLDDRDGKPGPEFRLPKVVRLALRPTSGQDFNIMAKTQEMRPSDFKEFLSSHLIPNHVLPFYHPIRDKIAFGAVEYYPLVLGYASTFHKSQGLQFDRVQIDFRSNQAGNPQMMYVALSRCRSLEGLLLAGDPTKLPRRIVTSPQVSRFV